MTTTLARLSDQRLLSRLDDLAARERRITLCILDHLGEVERRGLYLSQGYGSMFSYCTARLGYSASAASRRIRTARCIRRFPRVRELLVCTRVNLSTVSLVAGILTDANHARVLERIAGRSQREVEAIAAEFRPRPPVRDRIQPVCVRPVSKGAPAPSENPTLACEYDRSGRGTSANVTPKATAAAHTGHVANLAHVTQAEHAAPATPATSDDGSTAAPDTETQFVVRFAAGPELVRQIEAARALLSFKVPANAPLERVLGAVLEDFIERNDPARRTARRARRNGTKKEKNARTTVNPRAIPAPVRDTVLVYSGGRCEYVSPSGRRCEAALHLQVDHIVPVARGGTAARENLRVLCAQHNRLEARRLLGAAARVRCGPGNPRLV